MNSIFFGTPLLLNSSANMPACKPGVRKRAPPDSEVHCAGDLSLHLDVLEILSNRSPGNLGQLSHVHGLLTARREISHVKSCPHRTLGKRFLVHNYVDHSAPPLLSLRVVFMLGCSLSLSDVKVIRINVFRKFEFRNWEATLVCFKLLQSWTHSNLPKPD